MSHVQDRWQRTVRHPDGSKTTEPTSRNKVGKRYRVRYQDPSGKWRARSFDRKADADRFASRVSADILNDNYIDPGAGRIALRDYALTKWLPTKSYRTQTTREEVTRRLNRHILPALGDKTLSEIARSPFTVKEWLAGMTTGAANDGKPISLRFASQMLTQLTAILDAAIDDGRIAVNPCRAKTVKLGKIDEPQIVPWTTGQVVAVRTALPEMFRGLVDAGAGLGLRQGEVFGLSPEDVDWLRGVVHIRRQVIFTGGRLCFALPKFGRERDIPLPGSVSLLLSAHLAEFPATPITLPWMVPGGKEVRRVPLMFTSIRGKAMRRGTFDMYQWVPAVTAQGFTTGHPNGFHALRHHYASVLLDEGVSIKELAANLGHRDAAFTLRVYAHLMPQSGGRTRAAVDAAFRQLANGPETAREA